MEHFWIITAVCALTAVAVIAQHYTIGRTWRANELARRTAGHATVLVALLLLVPFGVVELADWLVVLVITGVAGATLAALRVTEDAKKARKYVAFSKRINGVDDDAEIAEQ